jgi:hypothetical protein
MNRSMVKNRMTVWQLLEELKKSSREKCSIFMLSIMKD